MRHVRLICTLIFSNVKKYLLFIIFSLFACNSDSKKILVADVHLSPSSTSMYAGNELSLTATITPNNATNKTLYWDSDNYNVATVSAFGVVMAKSDGSAVITVTTEDGAKSASCDIEVSTRPVPIQSVNLSPSTVVLSINQTQLLEYVITPNQATNQTISWESGNPSVATVEEGLVTAISEGKSIVTVTTADGGKKATCEVTVRIIRVTSVSLSKSIINLGIGEDFTLAYQITPDDAENQNVSWESSNTSVATVEDGLVTAVSEGSAVITITTEDGAKKASCPVNVLMIHDPTINTVDRFATKETKALYRNLLAIQSVGAMFGHHDGLMYGKEWNQTNNYVQGESSDVKEICGDFPAVYSLGFETIMDNRWQNNATSTAQRRRLILEAYGRGEVITACLHHNNPLTLRDSWDNSNRTVVKEILTEGSTTNVRYKQWLDRLADFANDLKDPSGTLIPILFRPYHEHTQSWSWWGSTCTTQQEFISFWRWTIEYLRDFKGVHNFLYVISPQMDGDYGNPGTRNRLLFRWPGDEWVDFLGMDCYHGTYTNAYRTNLNTLVDVAKEKGKPCGVAETGIEGIRSGSNPIVDYWTVQMLAPLKQLKENKSSTVSMVVMWRNQYNANPFNDNHFFGPWIKHPSADDFVLFYEDPITIFSRDLPNMYE